MGIYHQPTLQLGKLWWECSSHRVKGRLDLNSGSLAPKLVHLLTRTWGHFRSVGYSATTESKPLILQLRKQGPTETVGLPKTHREGMPEGYSAPCCGLELVKGGSVGGLSAWMHCPSPPCPQSKCPFFPFWERVQLGRGWKWVDSGSLPTSFILGIPRQPLSWEECSASSPQGRGLFPCPTQACFVLAPQGPSWPSPARSSEHFF